MNIRIGMDVGSTTLKVLVLDEENRVISRSYERHKSQVRGLAYAKIEELHESLQGHTLHFAITGSAGLGIAKDGDFPFVQEVFATAQAVKQDYP